MAGTFQEQKEGAGQTFEAGGFETRAFEAGGFETGGSETRDLKSGSENQGRANRQPGL
jgi:hypothetical protein